MRRVGAGELNRHTVRPHETRQRWRLLAHSQVTDRETRDTITDVQSGDRDGSTYLGSVQSLSHVRLFLSITDPQSLFKLISIKSVMPSNHLILCRPLPLLPSIFPSIRVFSNKSVLCMRWPKYCSFSISPSNERSGLISFRIDWFDLLAVQGALKSLL